tara:strand:- start:367 stop:633 length:267 start_codon:yes stop_codon:yes gene_type:complete
MLPNSGTDDRLALLRHLRFRLQIKMKLKSKGGAPAGNHNNRPSNPKLASIRFLCEPKDKAAWKAKANNESGGNLSAWITKTLKRIGLK